MNNINDETNEMIISLAKEIAKAINYASSSYDRTFVSVVREINSDSTCVIRDEFGVERRCLIGIPNANLEVGQRVYVTIPQNNVSKMFISAIQPKQTPRTEE